MHFEMMNIEMIQMAFHFVEVNMKKNLCVIGKNAQHKKTIDNFPTIIWLKHSFVFYKHKF